MKPMLSRERRIAEVKKMKSKLENMRSGMGHQPTTLTYLIDSHLMYIDFLLKDKDFNKDVEIEWWSLTDTEPGHTLH
ncbi:hypothetical protein PMI36_01478 [Pseudomonas sp. GM79]|uniref:hypothetical protein n=1 Tax=Pseudomonas sp. GM79 TaxID=1144338 RepID=UPI00026F6180|nr:hypothetical protein [Pseudomonas sp. GM79]EJN25860.1 hypothetical protein PMI36_01478 [Pseudomonas sp. GM79]